MLEKLLHLLIIAGEDEDYLTNVIFDFYEQKIEDCITTIIILSY